MSTAQINIAESHAAGRPSLVAHMVRIAFSTSVQHWMFWLWVFFCGLMGMMTIDNPSKGTLWMWPFLALYTGGLVPILFVEHLVWDRALLVPHYRQVHLAAMAIAAVTMAGLITAWMAICCRNSIWPMSGVALLAFALGGWSIGRRLAVVVFVSGITLALVSSQAWPVSLLYRFMHLPAGNLGSGLIGCLLLARLARWFWRLDEDQNGYDACRHVAMHSRLVLRMPRRHSWSQPGLARGAGQSPLWGPTALAYRAQDRLLEAGLRYGPRLPGWSVLRWELAWPGLLLATSTGLVGLWCACLSVGLVNWSWAGWEGFRPILEPGVIGSGAVFLIVLVLLPHLERRSLVGFESLRPVARGRLLRQWGAAVMWRMIAAGLILGGLIDILRRLNHDRPNALESLVWCFYLVAGVSAYSASLLLLRTVGTEVLQAVVAFFGSMLYYLSFAMLAVVFEYFGGLWLITAAAWAIALASVVILCIAYRRWLSADLD